MFITAVCVIFLSITCYGQLLCHNRLLRGFRFSRGRSSTPRLFWSIQSPGCAYKSHLGYRNTSQEVRLKKRDVLITLGLNGEPAEAEV